MKVQHETETDGGKWSVSSVSLWATGHKSSQEGKSVTQCEEE